jgi:transposase
MRKSFHGLSALVYQHLGNPEDGAYYVFVNRLRTHVKILYFDGDGLVLWYKRLEKGRFVIPEGRRDKIEMDRRQLSMLLEGVIPLTMERRYSSVKKRKNMVA